MGRERARCGMCSSGWSRTMIRGRPVSSPAWRWPVRALAALGLALLAMATSIDGALAHATLMRTEPADGTVIADPPARLSLTFNEPISPLVLKLIRPDGTAVVLHHHSLRGETLDIHAPGDLGTGTYVLSWRVVSEDGHPVGGSIVFSVGAPTRGAAVAAGDAIDWPVRIAIWAGKAALLAGLFLGVGGAFHRAWIAAGSRHGVRFAGGAIVLGLAAAPLCVGLQGLDALGAPLSAIIQRIAWTTGFDTSFGRTASTAVCALIAGLVSLGISRPTLGKALSLLALVGVGIAMAASGHAGAADPQWLTRPAVFLHGVGIAFWTGALVPLAAQLAAVSPDAVASLRRFSRAIPVALVVLSAAGIVLAVIQLEHPGALWTTDYGRVLIAKIILLLAVFALAAVNRWRLTRPVVQGVPGAGRRLARAILIETVLVLGILGVAALWRFTPPPRSLATAAAEPAYVHIHTTKAAADLTIAPGRAGPATAAIVVRTGDFKVLDAREVGLVLTNPAAGVEAIRHPARKADNGIWRVDGLVIPMPGHWSVRVDILVSDFELVRLESAIDIRP